MAGLRNITIYAGDTYLHELRIKDSANAAINITSHTFTGQIKVGKLESEKVATFTANISNGAAGIVQFLLTANVTANITPGTYYYDIQQINGTVVTTLLGGKVVVQGDITRG